MSGQKGLSENEVERERLGGRGGRQVAHVYMKMGNCSVRTGGNNFPLLRLRGYSDGALHYSAGFRSLKRNFLKIMKQIFLNSVGCMLRNIQLGGERTLGYL